VLTHTPVSPFLCDLVRVLQPIIARLHSGRSLFLGGLTRVDYFNEEDPEDSVLMTWFGQLSLHLTNTGRECRAVPAARWRAGCGEGKASVSVPLA
jgi:hypothetical protein